MPLDKDLLITGIHRASYNQLKQIAAILGIQEGTGEQVGDVFATTESVEVDPRLKNFHEMYQKWSRVSKSRLTWPQVQTAMFANDGALLKQVNEVPEVVMFGAKDGNILFTNGGDYPILTGMPYSESKNEAKKIGLKLFPYAEPCAKSEEILMCEEFTGKPLVQPRVGEDWASTWLDNGDEDAKNVCVLNFDRDTQNSLVDSDSAVIGDHRRGVRGLLIAKA